MSDTQYITIWCKMCGGVAHPSSGCQYSENFVVCGPCVRRDWKWLLNHINTKGGRKGMFFYEYATTISKE